MITSLENISKDFYNVLVNILVKTSPLFNLVRQASTV